MTHTKQAIKDAIEGGWRDECRLDGFLAGDTACFTSFGGDEAHAEGVEEWAMTIHQIFLDPAFWLALGKTRGWDTPITKEDREKGTTLRRGWIVKQNQFIGSLQDGDTYEEALSKIV